MILIFKKERNNKRQTVKQRGEQKEQTRVSNNAFEKSWKEKNKQEKSD